LQYHIARDGQMYGPYTLEDLRRYVASGNVLLTDMAKSEEMPEWAPVSQVVGMPAMPPAYPQPGAALPSPGMYQDAPNLHWGLVLLISLFTCSLFMFVWNLVLSSWMRRVKPDSKALFYYAAAAVLAFLTAITGHSAQIHMQAGNMMMWNLFHANPLGGLFSLASWVVRLIARFTMRSDLEEHFNGPEPVGLRLSGVMTFFFGGLYFQYHLNRINEMKRIARYRGVAV
jgi:hypothetical protein